MASGFKKLNIKYVKDYHKNKESSYLKYWNVNNGMSQKLPVNDFKWVEETSPLNEHFIISYSEESYKGYSLEVDVKYFEK